MAYKALTCEAPQKMCQSHIFLAIDTLAISPFAKDLLFLELLEIPTRSSFSQGIEVTSPRDENCTRPRQGQFSSRGDVTELPSEKEGGWVFL
jgi:hypothetical protein